MRYTVRPISDRTWFRPPGARESSRFDSTWSKTLQLLGREVDFLGGRDVVLEVDVEERHIRNDGMIRANARAASPAVVVAFESMHGPMLYRCDRFVARYYSDPDDWQQNVRAIALTLEALRAVDRYGATETGQQYAGFKALPAGRATPAASSMTTGEAYDLLAELLDVNATAIDVEDAVLVRRARALAHPDRNDGDRSLWDQVEQAAAALGLS